MLPSVSQAQGVKHMKNSETLEKALFERAEQKTTALDAARVPSPTAVDFI
jgi:hypothetical protein